MISPNEETLIALSRISGDSHYSFIVKWLKDLYSEQAIAALKVGSEVSWRQAQGSGLALEHLILSFENPSESLKKYRETRKEGEFDHAKSA